MKTLPKNKLINTHISTHTSSGINTNVNSTLNALYLRLRLLSSFVCIIVVPAKVTANIEPYKDYR